MWYVLQVKGGKELEILDQLINAGYEAMVPRQNKLIHSAKKWVLKETLLFSNYVFIKTDFKAKDFYKITNIAGVLKFLGNARSPSSLTYLEAEWIKLLSNENRPLDPTIVEIDEDGKLKLLNGILLNFKSRIKSFDKRQKKATFEITICGEEVKEITLSIEIVNDLSNRKSLEVEG